MILNCKFKGGLALRLKERGVALRLKERGGLFVRSFEGYKFHLT